MLSVWATLRLCKGKRGWRMQKQTLIHNVLECDLQEILSMKALGHGTLKKKIGGEEPTTNPIHLNNPNNDT